MLNGYWVACRSPYESNRRSYSYSNCGNDCSNLEHYRRAEESEEIKRETKEATKELGEMDEGKEEE